MSKFQAVVVGLAAILFLLLYLFVPTKTRDRAQIDKTRALQAESIPSVSAEQLLQAAKETLSKEQLSPILRIEDQLASTESNEERANLLVKISSEWNKLNSYALGGFYAEEVAKINQSDSAWSIAGTTYYSGFQQAKDTLIRQFCVSKAITAFENAISLNPADATHKVNLGLCYVNGSANPMKGILMIRDLAEKNPENVLASVTLGKLSMRTNQYEKAINRFETALKFDAKNVEAHYWLGQAFLESGEKGKAKIALGNALLYSRDDDFKRRIEQLIKDI